ncbi:MAG TPA: hypothetical protein VH370_27550 [Humisphaera sp.]|nr:hypothetical protein [Humisphaera sp.]
MATAFDNQCWNRVQAHLNAGPLNRVAGAPGRSIHGSVGNAVRVLGRRHVGHAHVHEYFFNLESRQINNLQNAPAAYVALACGAGANPDLLLVPLNLINPQVALLSTTSRPGFVQHNLRIVEQGGVYHLAVPNGVRIALNQYLI